MDKLFKVNKKLKYSIIIITIIGIISGALFLYVLKDNDLESIHKSIENFSNSVLNNNLNYFLSLKSSLITNIIYILIIWLLGFTIIGFPIILFMYFIKSFTIGFAISSLVHVFKLKGIIYSIIYIFPHNFINIIIYAYLTIHSIIYSYHISSNFFKKNNIDYKSITDKHKYLLLISILGIIITSLYGTYIMPYIFKIVLNLIK